MKKIILVGAGGHAKSCIDVIESNSKFKIFGLVDKNYKKIKNIFQYRVIGDDNDLREIFLKYHVKYAHISIGLNKDLKKRRKIFLKLKKIGFKFPPIISKKSHISRYSTIDDGSIVMHNVVINSNVRIGMNCIINTNSLIEHDSVIGDHCNISTSSTINSTVRVGNNCFIGSGTIIKQCVSIGENSFIKMGKKIFKNQKKNTNII
jgi:sugar O-acyltransferase (sialic acid O-acetyltransferase NeuD family)|tara:strand:- start:1953 stop:2567 length:615 start_codon:yes stop_codon:yes gene_type:complete